MSLTRIDRNVYQREGSSYYVALTRRGYGFPHDIIRQPAVDTLPAAIAMRNLLESKYPKRPPGFPARGPRKTPAQYMAARRAAWKEKGLCVVCGDPKEDPDYKCCRGCREIRRLKYAAKHT